ncbi:MAG: Nudix family hydrolase [Chromatiales bacterium]|jgi:8-oxo-dGTP diphosphatase
MLIQVAAAAILDAEGRVLISKRADHLHQGGLWEFPGGKLEAGETPEAALLRELKEELDILPRVMEPLIRIHHQYDERHLRLDFFRVTRFEGQARGVEGQPLRWLDPAQMQPEEFPAADRPVITALQLPDHYLITGENPANSPDFLQRLESSLKAGLSLVQLRAHELEDRPYRDLLNEALELSRRFGAKLLVNRPRNCCQWIGLADGIHLTSQQLLALAHRPGKQVMVGASCHNPEELARAAALQLDYALLSPVMPTASHPESAGIGWERFAEWVDGVNLPVYALGGMRGELLQQAKEAGGQGIAGIRGFWAENG